MILTIPLDKTVKKINIAISSSPGEVTAMHIMSDQSMHFKGTFPDETIGLVYTKNYSNKNKLNGYFCDDNVIKTKGNHGNIDDFLFNKVDLRFILIDKKLFDTYLHQIFGEIDLEPIYSSMTYRLNDEGIDLFLNIHKRTMRNEHVPKEEIILLLSKIYEAPIGNQLSFIKGYDLIHRATSLMTDHLKDQMSIEDFSQTLDITRRTLELAFKKHLNISPKMYYNRLLLLMIERELRKTEEESITAVITEYQIYSLSQFGASFKSYFGKKPSEVLNISSKDNPFGWNERIFIEYQA